MKCRRMGRTTVSSAFAASARQLRWGVYTQRANQSQEGRDSVPSVRTNRRREGSILQRLRLVEPAPWFASEFDFRFSFSLAHRDGVERGGGVRDVCGLFEPSEGLVGRPGVHEQAHRAGRGGHAEGDGRHTARHIHAIHVRARAEAERVVLARVRAY
eukprot:2158273-Pyramimonas_sp.AAC.1